MNDSVIATSSNDERVEFIISNDFENFDKFFEEFGASRNFKVKKALFPIFDCGVLVRFRIRLSSF